METGDRLIHYKLQVAAVVNARTSNAPMHAYVTPSLFFGPNQHFSSMDNDGSGNLVYLLFEEDPPLIFEEDGYVDANGLAFKGRKFIDMNSMSDGTVLLTEILDDNSTEDHTIKVGVSASFHQILPADKANAKKRVANDELDQQASKKPKLAEVPTTHARFLEDIACIIHPEDVTAGLFECYGRDWEQVTWGCQQPVRLHPTNFGNLKWHDKLLSEYRCAGARVTLIGDFYHRDVADEDIVPQWALKLEGQEEEVVVYMTGLQFKFALDKPPQSLVIHE